MGKTYEIPYTVNLDDLDYWGCISHYNWIRLFERTRTSLFRREYESLGKDGIACAITDISIQYKRPGKFNDELIIETTFSKKGKVAMLVDQVAKDSAGQIYCQAQIEIVFINRDQRPIRIPKGAEETFLA